MNIWTVILLFPDYLADYSADKYRSESFIYYTEARSAKQAVRQAQQIVCDLNKEATGFDNMIPEDFRCIAAIKGWHTVYCPKQ